MLEFLTANDVSNLQKLAQSGDRAGYWTYLAMRGDPYATLAIQVVRNDSYNGVVANRYAEMTAAQNGIALTPDQWEKVGDDLLREDFKLRSPLGSGLPRCTWPCFRCDAEPSGRRSVQEGKPDSACAL